MHILLRRAVVAVVSSLAVAGGCTSHVHYPLEARFVPVSRRPPPDLFEYQRLPTAAFLSERSDRELGYAARSFTMPASFENGQPGNLVTGTYYASDISGKKPLVIVLPVWGVSEYPSTKMARAILKRSGGDMNVLRVDGKERLIPWKEIKSSKSFEEFVAGVSNAAKRLKHAVIDVRRLIDWAQTRDEVDRHRLGLVGFSISAISGTLVAQRERRIRSSVLVMGGANIGTIVSNCPGNEKDTRAGIIDALGLDVREYEQTVRALFEGLDPTDYPGRVNPETVLIVDAAKDECIPRSAREAWWEALGRPARISLNYTHRGSFLAMTPLGFNFLRARIYEHLARTL